jgi:hypothetical protein
MFVGVMTFLGQMIQSRGLWPSIADKTLRDRMGKVARLWLSFTILESEGPGFAFREGRARSDQAVHPSGVGKLVAVSKKWVTAAEDCDR